MKTSCSGSSLTFAHRAAGFWHSNLLPAILTFVLFLQAHNALAALNFLRGTPTTVGSVRFSSSPDSVTITAALTGPGTITSALGIAANRIQYDVISSDQGPMESWTLFYGPAVGPSIIGAFTPLGFVDSGGGIVPEGGVAYTTLFNAGYGVYTYNTGSPWTIDYEPDHITFSAFGTGGIPPNDGVGYLSPTHYLPSFAILYDPSLGNALVPATAMVGTATLNGQVYGPVPGNQCLSIDCRNITVETCNSCIPVAYPAVAVDRCCSNAVLSFNPPPGTCFPVNSSTTVTVTAFDSCGNTATNYFTVTVLPGANCLPTNCISIYSSNIVVYTCNKCTPVVYNVYAVDNCCPGTAGPTLTFNPPETTCFPVNSSTPVLVTANDQCGNIATNYFTVTVLPGPNCGNTNCISIYATNIVVYSCSNCTTVPFNVKAFDPCCASSGVTLVYNPPTNTCFPLNSTTPVQITGSDGCGNVATNYITVTVLPGQNCLPVATNCISIDAPNIVVYTCSNCIPVFYNVTASDQCCSVGVNLSYNPPSGTCFPLNSTTPVQVNAFDQCGQGAIRFFFVTVLPGANCGGATPGPNVTGQSGPNGTGTNYITIWWPPPTTSSAQLLESSDLSHWSPIPGATNPPYISPDSTGMDFFRLLYK